MYYGQTMWSDGRLHGLKPWPQLSDQAFVVWESDQELTIPADRRMCGCYSDRLFQQNPQQFNKAVAAVWPDNPLSQYFNNRKAEDIEQFLSLYFEHPVQLVRVIQDTNRASGYPLWLFQYLDETADSAFIIQSIIRFLTRELDASGVHNGKYQMYEWSLKPYEMSMDDLKAVAAMCSGRNTDTAISEALVACGFGKIYPDDLCDPSSILDYLHRIYTATAPSGSYPYRLSPNDSITEEMLWQIIDAGDFDDTGYTDEDIHKALVKAGFSVSAEESPSV